MPSARLHGDMPSRSLLSFSSGLIKAVGAGEKGLNLEAVTEINHENILRKGRPARAPAVEHNTARAHRGANQAVWLDLTGRKVKIESEETEWETQDASGSQRIFISSVKVETRVRSQVCVVYWEQVRKVNPSRDPCGLPNPSWSS